MLIAHTAFLCSIAAVPSSPTNRQVEIAAFLDAEMGRTGIMPTQSEIAAHFGFSSSNSIRSHLRLMEKKGMLVKIPGKARGLQRPLSRHGIPLLGDIAAGTPALAVEQVDEFLPVQPGLFDGEELFGLRVRGDSMKDEGIYPGDIAILNRQSSVASGSIAAVLYHDEATLKFLLRRRKEIVLRGANPSFADIVISAHDANELRVLGKYVGLIRNHGGHT